MSRFLCATATSAQTRTRDSMSDSASMSSQSTTSRKAKTPRVLKLDLLFESKHAVTQTALRLLGPAPSTTPGLAADASVMCLLSNKVFVTMKGVRVQRFVEGRRNVASLTLRVSRTAVSNLMDVDDALLNQARAQADAWFGAGNGVARVANVDEFFRASTATDRAAGVVAKLSLDVARSSRGAAPPFSAVEGSDIDLTLQLVGLRFLRQHVDVLWRLVIATPSEGPFLPEPLSCRPVSDDEEEDPTLLGPTPEERDAMFVDLLARLDADRTSTDNRLRELDALADLLEDGRDGGDISILETVSDRLDALSTTPP